MQDNPQTNLTDEEKLARGKALHEAQITPCPRCDENMCICGTTFPPVIPCACGCGNPIKEMLGSFGRADRAIDLCGVREPGKNERYRETCVVRMVRAAIMWEATHG